MNKQAVIIHGAYGNPEENWFPWLKNELEKLDYEVLIPSLPTPEQQHLAIWLTRMEQYQYSWGGKETILIGHSIGAAFALRLLMNHIGEPIRAAFLVAGFISQLGDPTFDNLNASFLDKPFDWQRIKEYCQQFFVYISDNDPYVPREKGQALATKLAAEMKLVEGAGHFNTEAGYTRFDTLLNDIKQL